jgi:hypothetical protein
VFQPLYLRELVKTFHSSSQATSNDQILYASIVCFCSLFHDLAVHQCVFLMFRTGLSCRTASSSLIYRKVSFIFNLKKASLFFEMAFKHFLGKSGDASTDIGEWSWLSHESLVQRCQQIRLELAIRALYNCGAFPASHSSLYFVGRNGHLHPGRSWLHFAHYANSE